MDDFVLNTRQIAQYPSSFVDPDGTFVLAQIGGVGGGYVSVTPYNLVNGALSGNQPFNIIGDVTIRGNLTAYTLNLLAATQINVQGPIFAAELMLPGAGTIGWGIDSLNVMGGALQFSQAAGWSFEYANGFRAQTLFAIAPSGDAALPFGTLSVGRDPVCDPEVATRGWIERCAVTSVDGKRGNVWLDPYDIYNALGIPSTDPLMTMSMTDTAIAGYVAVAAVTSFNGRTGTVVLTVDDTNAAMTASGAVAQSNTPPTGDNSNAIATTAFVMESFGTGSGFAPINSPQFTGIPTAPTPAPGTSTGQLATTAFVAAAISAGTAGVSSFNTRTGAVVLDQADIIAANGWASPALTGVPTAPTAPPATNSTQIATTAFVQSLISGTGGGVTSFNTRTGAVVLVAADVTSVGGALLASPTFTGTPAAPTPAPGTSNTTLATTAFVSAAVAAATAGVASWNGRTGAVTFQANDVSAVGGALLSGPAFSGVPTAPTATTGTSTQQIATTAFVQAAFTSATLVSSFNGRTGVVTLNTGDITGAGGAPIASPTFSGTPAAPTAALGTSSTQLATTAFVAAAISAGTAGVSSFNTRVGAVTFQASDLSAVGGALLASPTFTGAPAAPTAGPGTNTTQLATCAFVTNAISAIGTGVTTWNTRSGAVTMTGTDITNAGGALLASPTFSGVPAAPTAAVGTSTTQLATTAFVTANASSGNRVLLATVTASNQVSANFFYAFSATYERYEIDGYNIVPATDGMTLSLRCSTDGSTWDSGSNYEWNTMYVYTQATAPLNNGKVPDGEIGMGGYRNGSPQYPGQAFIKFFMPYVSGTGKHFTFWTDAHTSTGGAQVVIGNGAYNVTTPIKGVQLIFVSGISGGNILTGTFKLYGVVK